MADLNDLENDLSSMESQMSELNKRFPSIIGVESVKIIQQNFDKQGYDSGQGVTKWQKRSPATDKAYDYNRTKKYRTPKLKKKSTHKNPYKGSVYSSKNPILVQTGNLKDAESYRVSGNQIEIGVFPRVRSVGGKSINAVNYAKIHNEGGKIKAWGKKKVRMPKRQFQPKPGEAANPKIRKAILDKWQFEEEKIMSKWK